MKSRASSSASTSSLRPSEAQSGIREILCDHGLVSRLHVSRSELNPGRRYYKCPYWQPGGGVGACIFFEWSNVELSSWYRDMFNKLKNEKLALENENKMLRAELVGVKSGGPVEMEVMACRREKDERCISAMDSKARMREKIEESEDVVKLNFYKTAFFGCVVFIICLIWLK